MSKLSPWPWRLELVQQRSFGVGIVDANGKEVVRQDAAAFSSAQNSRLDNENGVGFPYRSDDPKFTRDAVIAAIQEQDANARVMTAAPEMLQARRYCETLIACSGINGSAQTLACVRAVIAKADAK
ncbi:hypothetical protein [Nevskia ramosa]|uniref:hypothetical protein n=1 Tax=Nevskia ramosa TaxID=64002 RepID=UPI003D0D646E